MSLVGVGGAWLVIGIGAVIGLITGLFLGRVLAEQFFRGIDGPGPHRGPGGCDGPAPADDGSWDCSA